MRMLIVAIVAIATTMLTAGSTQASPHHDGQQAISQEQHITVADVASIATTKVLHPPRGDIAITEKITVSSSLHDKIVIGSSTATNPERDVGISLSSLRRKTLICGANLSKYNTQVAQKLLSSPMRC